MARVAVLGLGAMGRRMAARLVAAGHAVVVWNRSSGVAVAGADRAETPAAAVSDVDVALSMVRDDAASKAVWMEGGALAALPEGAVGLECSTVSVDWARALGAAFAAAGRAYLDAPLAGSRPQAEAGALIFLVGGSAAAVAQAKPVLSAMGKDVRHVGPAGTGAVAKLAVNALLGVQVAAMAELLGMAEAAGVPRAVLAETVAATPVAGPALAGSAAAMAAGNFAPMFPLELLGKDLGFLQATGAAVPVSAAAAGVVARAVSEGAGAENMTALARLYLGRAA